MCTVVSCVYHPSAIATPHIVYKLVCIVLLWPVYFVMHSFLHSAYNIIMA